MFYWIEESWLIYFQIDNQWFPYFPTKGLNNRIIQVYIVKVNLHSDTQELLNDNQIQPTFHWKLIISKVLHRFVCILVKFGLLEQSDAVVVDNTWRDEICI